MGIFGDDQGKTEKPTPTRLNDVRNRGDTPLSRELVQGGLLVVAALSFRWCGGWLVDSLSDLMRHGLDVNLDHHHVSTVPHAYQEILHTIWTVGAPFATLVLTFVAATLLLGYGQIGVHWATEVVGFKLEKINPFTNWKRLFNLQSLVRTGFAVIKLAVLVFVVWWMLGDRWQSLLHLHEQEFAAAADEIAGIALSIMLWVGLVVFAISAVDYGYQRFEFEKRNMMTKQEVEDERKRAEGDPTMKQRQRRARIDLLRHRMMAAVPKADVIITNPTHFSVALRYDRKRDVAPTVVAKGVDEVAMHIREIAKEHGVPLMEDPPLARALFRTVKVGQTVPEKFYHAVAAVLSHVYRMKGRTA
ncbi:MAG: flagellar biosynthesis protein FlhB [Planctomycetes bacterium]|jgi:flagellar biosynthetic protein FlhB|nr:flagellar biosynthesis protein FlhB [Planctomycetota bacterium]MCC7066450.1 flagellar biosynthesis protein FlhB [Planctomycetota bacterium]